MSLVEQDTIVCEYIGYLKFISKNSNSVTYTTKTPLPQIFQIQFQDFLIAESKIQKMLLPSHKKLSLGLLQKHRSSEQENIKL